MHRTLAPAQASDPETVRRTLTSLDAVRGAQIARLARALEITLGELLADVR
jgi:hypothetical protein